MRRPTEEHKSPSGFTLRQLAGVVAAIMFIIGGVKMLNIESQSGDTILEAFFQAMAFVSFGLAAYSLGRLAIRAEKQDVTPRDENAETRTPPEQA